MVYIPTKDVLEEKTFKGADVDMNTTLAYRLLKQKVENILCINYFSERTIKLVQDFGHFIVKEDKFQDFLLVFKENRGTYKIASSNWL